MLDLTPHQRPWREAGLVSHDEPRKFTPGSGPDLRAGEEDDSLPATTTGVVQEFQSGLVGREVEDVLLGLGLRPGDPVTIEWEDGGYALTVRIVELMPPGKHGLGEVWAAENHRLANLKRQDGKD